MSLSLARKALEITDKLDTTTSKGKSGVRQIETTAKSKKKVKLTKKKAAEKLGKQNLKILRALDYTRPSSTKPKNKKRSKGSDSTSKSESKTVFTEEDFKKFEEEYFVT